MRSADCTQRAIRRRPTPRWKILDSIIFIRARDEYLQKEGILTKIGKRRWWVKFGM
ncbi:MAG: hypothetical protein HZB92_07380 [Euryarchaeota archaeon]|nr:hypothetical protein [Euryarchaeota archaeon]